MVRSFANEQAKSDRDDDARVRRFDGQVGQLKKGGVLLIPAGTPPHPVRKQG